MYLFAATRDTDAIGERKREAGGWVGRERKRGFAWEWDRIESAMWITRKLLVVVVVC